MSARPTRPVRRPPSPSTAAYPRLESAWRTLRRAAALAPLAAPLFAPPAAADATVPPAACKGKTCPARIGPREPGKLAPTPRPPEPEKIRLGGDMVYVAPPTPRRRSTPTPADALPGTGGAAQGAGAGSPAGTSSDPRALAPRPPAPSPVKPAPEPPPPLKGKLRSVIIPEPPREIERLDGLIGRPVLPPRPGARVRGASVAMRIHPHDPDEPCYTLELPAGQRPA